ncbi:hypothetical protein GCM10009104_18020 [Marinobacterium maritimum]|uniref:General secretion pathway protein L n=1 Tax=Marinobacterium maritimum TaxID=500162 RepID=A0ABN1I640_9GAMM
MNTGFQQLAQQLSGSITRFWYWWTGELSALIPDRWRRRFEGGERTIRYVSGAFEVPENGSQRRIPLDACASDPVLANWRGQKSASSRLLVLMPREDLLHKVISLPAATEPRLQSVLGFELDRHTPFSTDQASFGFRVIKRDRTAQRIDVELFTLPNTRRQQIIEGLAQAGLSPEWILPEGAERNAQQRSTLSLMPEQVRPPMRRTLRSRPVLVVLVLALLTGILFFKREQRLQELELAVGPLEQAAEEARAIRNEVDTLEEGGRFILERRNATPATLVLLDELTRLLPDHTWLSRFELQRGELRIQGESANASSLIGLLEESPLLQAASFTSPVTINPRSRKERFSLRAQLSPRAGEEILP